jgi:hypothetical protein
MSQEFWMAREEETISLAMPELATQHIPQPRGIVVNDANIIQQRDGDSSPEEPISQLDIFGSHQLGIESTDGAQIPNARQNAHSV